MNKLFENVGTEITKEELATYLSSLAHSDNRFMVESEDSGVVFFSMNECRLNVQTDCGVDGELSIFKDGSEIDLDFDIIFAITTESEDSFRVEFNNGMSDVILQKM